MTSFSVTQAIAVSLRTGCVIMMMIVEMDRMNKCVVSIDRLINWLIDQSIGWLIDGSVD